jgi:hypothetical protein
MPSPPRFAFPGTAVLISQLKKLLAETMLENAAMKDVLTKKW